MNAKPSAVLGGAATPAAPSSTMPCPSCRQAMTVLKLQSRQGLPLELDLCFSCHGLWVDGAESQQLAPQSIIDLFKALHAHKDDPTHPLQSRMGCPRCRSELQRGVDRTRSGEYTVYRCVGQRHGRFSTFASFMVEKGFVRHLNPLEVKQLAAQVQQIQCSSCGASVDLKTSDRCGHCGAAFALLDPKAVSEALAHFAQQADRQASGMAVGQTLATDGRPTASTPRSTTEAYADLAIERERARERLKREQAQEGSSREYVLWELGLDLVLQLLRRW